MSLEVGIKGEASVHVDFEHTAKSFGSGYLEVFASPMMVALMEKAALDSVQKELDEGMSTVGTKLEVTHDAPTPLDHKVVAKSELIEIDGRRLVFKVEAFDDHVKIGGGIHERFIVDVAKFMAKANAKKDNY